jgi:hypothetical protein
VPAPGRRSAAAVVALLHAPGWPCSASPDSRTVRRWSPAALRSARVEARRVGSLGLPSATAAVGQILRTQTVGVELQELGIMRLTSSALALTAGAL